MSLNTLIKTKTDTILVIDGNSLIHRAFHAIPLLSTTEGLPTNAVYGFTNMLLKILNDIQPKWVAVAFDKSKITFRTKEYSEYKAHRKATPEELRSQFSLVKEVLNALSIKWCEAEGYEADDLIGTIIKKAEQENISAVILSGDKDVLQLVSASTKALLTKKGISDLEEFNEENVFKKFGVHPKQITDYKGLTGDQSDNIPGVPGIGPKTATKLLQEFTTLEEIIVNSSKIPARTRNLIEHNTEQALLSKRLATIIIDVPINISINECIRSEPNEAELLDVFKKLEFKKLLRDMLNITTDKSDTVKQEQQHSFLPQPGSYTVNYHTLSGQAGFEDLLLQVQENGQVALALEGDREKGLISAALCLAEGQNYFLPINSDSEYKSFALKLLQNICENSKIKKYCYDTKNDIWLLHPHGIELHNPGFDIMIADYLLNPGKSAQSLAETALSHLDIVLPADGEAVLPSKAESIFRMVEVLQSKLLLQEQENLYYEVELPLIEVLANMEKTGVNADKEQLQILSEELSKKLQILTMNIYEHAGEVFNINSTKQLGIILFEKLKLKVGKKTKTGYSTDVTVLEELADAHPIITFLLEYRQLAKLKSTYVDGLTGLINQHTGKLHTTFHQAVTATGRLSSSEPNLQNIPIRLEVGRKIRKFFVPRRAENFIFSADYSQIELRILAHIAQDRNLLDAFEKHQDIHTRTAAEVFGVTMEEVTPEMRGRAKAVNFGIVYGISDFGLARDIKVTRKEAGRYIDNYFARYSGVKSYIDRVIREAREKGYVTTILNRRRYLPDLFSSNRNVRSFGERTAMNTPIQGSASDIIKLAMVMIYQEMNKRQLSSTMILQVHDELIFDVPANEVQEMQKLVKSLMENAVKLSVPLVVDMKIGPNWYDVQKI